MPSSMVDWDLAVSAATTMAGSGPAISRAEAEAVVAELRADAAKSTGLVREYTGLVVEERSAPLLVVDRTGWIQANVDGFATVISPLVDKLQERKGPPSPVAQAVGSRITGLELGGLLGFLASKVLGQFDPFYTAAALPPGPSAGAPSAGTSDGAGASVVRPPAGRLLLVAPNIVHVERQLEVDPTDFRLWVTLHEETHRVQFTAVPWMRDHIQGEIANLVSTIELDPSKLAGLLGEGARRLSDLVRGDDDVTLLDLITSPQQREVVDRITAVMSLLEGHADVVMDGVGPEVIPSVAEIRRKFNRRRKGTGPLDRVLRKLLGLDAKMAQYRHGAAFVRGVVDRVGMPGLNKVWVEPSALPTKDEIADPDRWVRRVHG